VGSTDLSYTAKGVSVDISASDTLRNIVTKINAASQPQGHDLKASVVGNKLVLTGAQTGANHAMVYTDGANLGLGADLQSAQNALFTVNGMNISRASNTGLTDVVDGATINFSADAEGKTARLSIGANTDKAVNAINTFVTKFNAAFTHLTQKMALTSKTEGTKTTYTRGPLSGDNGFRGLRLDLYNQLGRTTTNGGNLKALSEIGLTFDKDMKLVLDSTKFTNAMKSSSTDVKALLDTAMGQYDSLLTRYAGTSGFVQSSLTSMDGQIKGFDQRLNKYTESLTARRKGLIDQYFQYQTQLADIGYEAQMFGVNLTGSSSSSVNVLG
jgi:flagellar hook-associated protein 2